MRKCFLLLPILLLTLAQPVLADGIVTFDSKQLPPEALAFTKRYFPEAQISHIKIEKEFLRVEKYEVLLTDRTEVEFDRKGVWTEVECDHVQVPLGLLPAYVSEYVEKHFPGAFVVKLERKRKELEVDLDNDLSLTFNHKGDLIDIDDWKALA